MLMNKRILLLLTVFLCSFLPLLQAQNWEDKVADNFSTISGDGVLTIMSAEEFALLAKKVNAGESLTFSKVKLGVEIDLNKLVWTPIGTETHPFVFPFDGAGHKITDLNVPDGNNIGLFGVVGNSQNSSEIKNIILISGTINGQANVGAFVGLLSNGEISNCVNENVKVTGVENVGGIAGSIKKGSLHMLYNAGGVTGEKALGGLAGRVSGATISQCYNIGTVYGKNESTGGIVGSLSGDGGKVEHVYNAGKVTGVSKTGGIVGSLVTATCSNAYNLAEVTGSSYTGSVAGDNFEGQLAGNVYDYRLISLKGLGTSTVAKDVPGQVEGKETKDLIATFTAAPWVVEEGMYPRLTGLAESDVAIVNAIPVTQLAIDGPGVADIHSIIADFTLPLNKGVSWSSNSPAIVIDVDKATVKRSTQTDNSVVLSVKKGSALRTYNVKVAQRIVYPVTLSVRESEKNDITITAVTEAEKLEENKYQLDKDSSFIFKVKWPKFYKSVTVLVNNEEVTLDADSCYTIDKIQEAKTVVVKGELKSYKVAVLATTGGAVAISPALEDGFAVYGTTLTLTATPDEFYQLDRWDPTGEKTKKVTVTVKSDTTYQAVFTEMATSKVTFNTDSKGVSFSVSNYPSEEVIQSDETFNENVRGYEIIRQGSMIRFKVGVLVQYNSANMQVSLVNGSTETILESDPNGIYEVKNIENNVTIKVTGVTLGGFKLKVPAAEEITGGKIDIFPLQDSYDYRTKVRVSAVADEGYLFDKWSNGETEMVFSFNITGDMILPIPLFTSTVANEPVVTNSPRVYSRGNTICIQQADGKNEEVSIVNITGTVVAKKRIYSSSSEIHVAHKGIYVVSVGKHVQKVVVR